MRAIPAPRFFHGWIIVFLAFLSAITYGLFYSYSAFIAPLESYLETSRAAISAAYTIYLAVYSAFAVPMGWLCDRHGPGRTMWLSAILIGGGLALCSTVTSLWQLYLLYGVVAAMGHGAIFVVPSATVSRWFVKKRGLAMGILASGLGFGLLVIPPVLQQIISTSGWRLGFITLGVTAFVLNGIVGSFIKARPEVMGLRPLGENEVLPTLQSTPPHQYSLSETLRTKAYWLVYFICVLSFAAEQMVLVHIIPYSGTIGISAADASLGLSCLGIGTIIGRVVIGALSDRIGRPPALIICSSVEAVAIFTLLSVNSTPSLFLVMLLLGFGYGGWVVLNLVIMGDFFGVKSLGTIIGVYFTAGIPAGLLGPLMGGAVFDLTGSYFLAIVISGVISVVSIVLAVLVNRLRRPGR